MAIASENLSKFIRFVMRDVTYHKHYMCTTQSIAGSSVDLLPDDVAFAGAGLTGVPVDNGTVGVSFQIAPGARAVLYFESGDPRKPRARIFADSAITMTLNGGSLPVARVGDQVVVTSATGAPLTGIITGGNSAVKA